MSTDRCEIIDEDSQIRILYNGSISTIISGPHGTHIEDAVIGAICQQAAAIAELHTENAALLAANRDMQLHFDAMYAGLIAMTAERDAYRDEFSGLCHTLSVGSEGRPEMTAADWRKRVDEGIEFLLQPLIASRDTVIAACAEAVGAAVSQGCSDEFRAMLPAEIRAKLAALVAERESDRIAYELMLNTARHERDQLRARLAAIDAAPAFIVCSDGPELIARPLKETT